MSGPGNGRGRFHLTHPYGLGSTVAREIERKLPEMTVTGPLWEGRMACEGPLKSAPRLLGLRTVDHAHAVVEECVEALAGRREGLLEAAKEASRRERDWSTPLEAWRLIAAKPPSQDPVDAGPSLRFRVTCTRSGKVGRADGTTSDHVAGVFGEALLERFGWRVDLEKYDVEVVVRLGEEASALTVHLGSAAGNSTRLRVGLTMQAAVHLAFLASPGPGETLLDPVCGTGTVVVMAASEFPHARRILGSDVSEKQLNLAEEFRSEQLGWRPSGFPCFFRADVGQLPLPSSSIDTVAADFPFGYRHGSKKECRRLYPAALRELGRVVRPGGRMAMLVGRDMFGELEEMVQESGSWQIHPDSRPHTVSLGVCKGKAALLLHL